MKSELELGRARVLVVINRLSGTVRTRGADQVRGLVTDSFAPLCKTLDVEMVRGNVVPRVRQAVEDGSHDIVIAGGGDGTIASVAQILMNSDIILGALPLGTMNLFVQAIGFSPSLEVALTQFTETEVAKIDVGMANDRVFLHQVSFGLQPRMARLRERRGYNTRIGKMIGAAAAILALALKPPVVKLLARMDGESVRITSPMLAVTNNPVGSGKHWSIQHRLDGGQLGLYVLNEFSLKTLLKLLLASLANRSQDDDVISQRTVNHLMLRPRSRFGIRSRLLRRRRRLNASIDGEVVRLASPVSISIKPRSLKVLMHVAPKS